MPCTDFCIKIYQGRSTDDTEGPGCETFGYVIFGAAMSCELFFAAEMEKKSL